MHMYICIHTFPKQVGFVYCFGGIVLARSKIGSWRELVDPTSWTRGQEPASWTRSQEPLLVSD